MSLAAAPDWRQVLWMFLRCINQHRNTFDTCALSPCLALVSRHTTKRSTFKSVKQRIHAGELLLCTHHFQLAHPSRGTLIELGETPKKDSRWNITAKRVAEHHVRHTSCSMVRVLGSAQCAAPPENSMNGKHLRGMWLENSSHTSSVSFWRPCRDFYVALSHVFFSVSLLRFTMVLV